MSIKSPQLIVIGGGLAGSEAAFQAANSGVYVHLYEMRPFKSTGAHVSPHLAELVCSNSLGSNLEEKAGGLLKNELRRMKSLLMECADQNALPAGSALAVDRENFSQEVTRRITGHPNIVLIREELKEIPTVPTIIASGPLTSTALSQAISRLTGEENLYFFDALAPILAAESINYDIVFRASRYEKGEEEGDYLNCPMTQEQYEDFVSALVSAKRIELKPFESELNKGVQAGAREFFEGCLPVEVLASRGKDALAFGPMRPVGLVDPKTQKRPYAVVQLRQDNLAKTLYNIVGFQTNLTFEEQERIFRKIPGLEKAEFVRHGQMHRNTFLASPKLLYPTLQFKKRENLFFAGQLTGVEGYVGNIATGLLAGINAARWIQGKPLIIMPPTTMLGALCHYITHASLKDFQPMKANFGILPPLLSVRINKKEKAKLYVKRAMQDIETIRWE